MKLVAKPEGNGDWMVIDTSMPKTEAFYYGMVAHGFTSRDEALAWICGAFAKEDEILLLESRIRLARDDDEKAHLEAELARLRQRPEMNN
jgi:hypothetical protein